MRPTVLLIVLLGLTACSSAPQLPSLRQEASGNRQAAADALNLQGVPYRPGGQSPQEGFDCSGLIQYVYTRQGRRLPRSSLEMAQQLRAVDINARQPGDVLIFNMDNKPLSHVGLYVGHDDFVHAPGQGRGVTRASLAWPFWRERLVGVRRP